MSPWLWSAAAETCGQANHSSGFSSLAGYSCMLLMFIQLVASCWIIWLLPPLFILNFPFLVFLFLLWPFFPINTFRYRDFLSSFCLSANIMFRSLFHLPSFSSRLPWADDLQAQLPLQPRPVQP